MKHSKGILILAGTKLHFQQSEAPEGWTKLEVVQAHPTVIILAIKD